MAKEEYASYLLRLWKSQVAGRLVCRVLLESTLTGQQQYFSSLEALDDFLRSSGNESDEGESELTDQSRGPAEGG